MRALPSVRQNRIRQAMEGGRRARGFHMIFPSPNIIELLGSLDFDFVYLDGEHGCFELSDIEEACRAAEISDITVAARVPTDTSVGPYLDRGVQSIIVPHVKTAEQARQVVDATFFRPKGMRSNGGARADRYWLPIDDYEAHFEAVNANTTLTIQIEDREAVDNLADILTVQGIDYYTIGKNDLSSSYGMPRLATGFPPELRELVAGLEKSVRDAGFPMKDDVMTLARVKDLLVKGGRNFLDAA